MVRNLPASQAGNTGSIPGKEMATHSGLLAWDIQGHRGAGQVTFHGVDKKFVHDLATKQQHRNLTNKNERVNRTEKQYK